MKIEEFEARATQRLKSMVFIKWSVSEFLSVIVLIYDLKTSLFKLSNMVNNSASLLFKQMSAKLTSFFDSVSYVVALKFWSFSCKRNNNSWSIFDFCRSKR